MDNGHISDLMRLAVHQGELNAVKTLTETYGLDYSERWCHGYQLLLEALHRKQMEIAKFLILSGSKINASRLASDFPLYLAVRNEDAAVTRLLLERGAEVNAKILHSDRGFALQEAVLTGNAEITTLLLDHGAQANLSNYKGRTPLHCAVEKSFGELVDLLLERGANVNARSRDGKTVLHCAVETASPGILQSILNYLPDVDDVGNYMAFMVAFTRNDDIFRSLYEYGFRVIKDDKDNVLFDAICRGDVNCLEELLQTRGDVRKLVVTTDGKCTPLHIAARYHNVDVATLLLRYGADVNAYDQYEKRPIVYSMESNDYNMFETLVSHVKDLNELLMLAVRRNDSKLVKCLLKSGANVNAREEKRSRLSVLHVAAPTASTDIIETLVDFRGDVNAVADDRTPLQLAVFHKNVDNSEVLLKNGANVNYLSEDAKYPYNCSVLELACFRSEKSPKLLKLLLDYGANVNACRLETALHRAAVVGSESCVEVLLQHGADVNVTHLRYSTTALDCARTRNSRGASLQSDRVRWPKAFDSLLRHVVKIKTVGLFVGERNLHYLEPEVFFKYCSKSDSSSEEQIGRGFPSECSAEAETLKMTNIDNSALTLYHILSAGHRRLIHLSCNVGLEEILNSADFEERFPIYGSMIKSKFIRGKERRRLEDESSRFWLKINSLLTIDCIDLIHRYLTNGDMRMLIRACK